MARRLRIQYPGACYHVINRGNFQHDVFASPGASRAFILVLAEVAERFGWWLHAFVVMRNHYHLALATPEPNLVDGMHWLQSTFAVRLTRFHDQHGHVFQGRYRALLIQDGYHLARVCDYIHLNPVRAGIVPARQVGDYQPSSLWQAQAGHLGPWFRPGPFLDGLTSPAETSPWGAYVQHLIGVVAAKEDDRNVPGAHSTGWALGTAAWRRELARQHAHLALASEMSASEIAELKRERWQQALDAALREVGKTLAAAAADPKGADWKITVARRLRARTAVPYRWIAATLHMGHPGAVRGYLARRILQSAD